MSPTMIASIIGALVVLLLAGVATWYYLRNKPESSVTRTPTTSGSVQEENVEGEENIPESDGDTVPANTTPIVPAVNVSTSAITVVVTSSGSAGVPVDTVRTPPTTTSGTNMTTYETGTAVTTTTTTPITQPPTTTTTTTTTTTVSPTPTPLPLHPPPDQPIGIGGVNKPSDLSFAGIAFDNVFANNTVLQLLVRQNNDFVNVGDQIRVVNTTFDGLHRVVGLALNGDTGAGGLSYCPAPAVGYKTCVQQIVIDLPYSSANTASWTSRIEKV